MATEEELKHAMKVFKKRLKATRLDEESRLGRGPLSSGGNSGIQSIIPPREIPQAIWDELVAHGQLTREPDGFYRVGSLKGGGI